MKHVFTGLFAAAAILMDSSGLLQPISEESSPRYDAQGDLRPPTDYRDWTFLSAGMDMSYSEAPAPAGSHSFDNVFAPRAAVEAFRRTGVWPDKTVLVLEVRVGASKGSINKEGQFQTGEIQAVELHVKDQARFKRGWAFFIADGAKPAAAIPATAPCYICHEQHAAADTTFVQFYPTLLSIATKLGTLSQGYLAESLPPTGH